MFNFFKKKNEVVVETAKKAQVTRVMNKLKNQKLEMLREEMEDLARKQEERMLEYRIEKMREDLYDDEEDYEDASPFEDGLNPDTLIMGMLTKVLNKTPMPVPTPVPQAVSELPQKTGLSDDQLREIKQKIPTPYLKSLKKMPEDELISFIKEKYPTIDDETIARATIILKE